MQKLEEAIRVISKQTIKLLQIGAQDKAEETLGAVVELIHQTMISRDQ